MPYRFLHDVPGLKMAVAGLLALIAAVADSATELPVASWESLGLKTAMAAVIIYLVRELSKQRDACADEARKREERILEVIESNTEAKEKNTTAMLELKAATETQTGYYKTVAQTLLNREIHPKLPE